MKVPTLLALLLVALTAQAIEPWQRVLVLDDSEIGDLLAECDWRATVTAKGPVTSLVQRIAEQTMEAGGNVVHILGATSVASSLAFTEQGVVNGRAFYCAKLGPLPAADAEVGKPETTRPTEHRRRSAATTPTAIR